MDVNISGLMKAHEEDGDYIGDDGLLYCGKCHTPKQMRLPTNPFTGRSDPAIVPTPCQCQKEADKAAEEREKMERFNQAMKTRWEDGISRPGGLCHTFVEDDHAKPKEVTACQRYVDHWEEMKAENIGILLYGSVGTGKTFLASCIGNGLLVKRVPVVSPNFPRLLNLLQETREKQKLLDRLSVYKLLILDDLGVERDSAYAAEQIFNIIDARASSKLPVVVTTNLTLEELEHPTSMQYARIYDRVLEMCPIRLKLTGDSRRRGNAEKRKEIARQILFG